VAEFNFCTDFLMNNTVFMNSANVLEIRGGRIRGISPKFDKISRICKPWWRVGITPDLGILKSNACHNMRSLVGQNLENCTWQLH
jgi:hypothetical protein